MLDTILKRARAILLAVSLAIGGIGLAVRYVSATRPAAAEQQDSPKPAWTAEGMIRLPHRTTVTAVAFSPDGKTLATGNRDSGLYLWDTMTGKELWRAETVSAHSIAFSPDGRTLAAGGWEGIVRLRNAVTGAKLRDLFTQKDLYTLAFSPNGEALATGGRSHVVGVLNLASGRDCRHFDGQGRIRALEFSPDGTLLACGTTDDRMHVWDTATGEEARAFRGKERRGGCLAFSPDGRILAADGSEKGTDFVVFREVATGEVIRRLRTDAGRIHALSFSPDGRALAVGGSKPVVKVWGPASGQLLGEFEGHRDQVFSVRFSPDGTCLAAGSGDKTALVWDVSRRMKKEKVSSPALTAERLERLWADLAGDDVPTVYHAVWTLSAAPEQAVPFLTAHLRTATAFDEMRVKQLIGDLDSERFAVRQRAETELRKMGWVVESALQRGRKDASSLEVRRRLANLLQEVELASPSVEWLRVARSVAVLEQVGTPEARHVLKSLAEGMVEARLPREAAAALRRLAKRPSAK